MSLKDRIRQDATRVFLREGHFAEPVVYYPGGDTSQGRTILAVVDRNPTAPLRADQRTSSADDVLIKVANDAERGVCGPTPGRDTFGIPVEPGSDVMLGPPGEGLALYRVEKVDVGMFALRLR